MFGWLLDHYLHVFVLALMGVGLTGMFVHRNLAKKIIGMNIFTTAIYLFFIGGAVQQGAPPPVLPYPEIMTDPSLVPQAAERAHLYVDPLPHLLILTAIVVGVGVTGIALSLMIKIHQLTGSVEEDEIIAKLSADEQQEANS